MLILDDYLCAVPVSAANKRNVLRSLMELIGSIKDDCWERAALKDAIDCVREYGVDGQYIDGLLHSDTVPSLIATEEVKLEEKGKKLNKLIEKTRK